MLGDLQFRFSRALLLLLTVAAVLVAVLNLQQQKRFEMPDDGVTWVDGAGGVVVRRVAPDSPGARAGLRAGDRLLGINGVPVGKSLRVPQILFGIGTWKKAEYHIEREGVDLRATLIIQPAERNPVIYYLYVLGLLHLLIGLYVFFRRERAPKA